MDNCATEKQLEGQTIANDASALHADEEAPVSDGRVPADEGAPVSSGQVLLSGAQETQTGEQDLPENPWLNGGIELRSMQDEQLAALLPYPREDANKYTRGTLTLVAGSDRYPGAACLAACAAQRMGAGYVQAVVPASVRNLLLADSPSVVAIERSAWDARSLETMKPRHPQAVCIGPGFDAQDDEGAELVYATLRHAACPVVLDGGALSSLTTKKGIKLLKRRFQQGFSTVVTPHEGEAARLAKRFGLPTDSPARLAMLISLAFGTAVVLKGPDTYVSDGECTFVVTEGTAALAKAGTGDVLAGVIGALLAQGLPAVQAGVLGAALHARAGKLAAERFTSIGVRAEDVCDCLPAAILSFDHGDAQRAL